MLQFIILVFNFLLFLSGMYFLLEYNKKHTCQSMYCKFAFYYFITNYLFDLMILLYFYTLTRCMSILMILGNIMILYNTYNYPLLPIWLVLISFITLYNIDDIKNENIKCSIS